MPDEAVLNKQDIIRMKNLFNTGEGKYVLERLRSLFYDTISYTRGDTYHTAFKEGHRDVIQFINNCVEFDVEQAIKTGEGRE